MSICLVFVTHRDYTYRLNFTYYSFTQTIYKNDRKVANVVPDLPVVPEQPPVDAVEQPNPEIEKLVEQLPAAVDPDAPVQGMDFSSSYLF